MHRHFFLENYLKILIMYKLIAMTETVFLTVHVVNDIYIKIHNDVIVYLLEFVYKYWYNFSFTCLKGFFKYDIIHVSKLFFKYFHGNFFNKVHYCIQHSMKFPSVFV